MNEYRLKHDPNYALLVELFGEETPPELEWRCKFCGRKIKGEDGVVVETDLDNNTGPTQWAFCSAKCFTRKVKNATSQRSI
ncbi:MAG: hypothetical protein QW356_03970 [Candidatus Hadarchaeales archaeon]